MRGARADPSHDPTNDLFLVDADVRFLVLRHLKKRGRLERVAANHQDVLKVWQMETGPLFSLVGCLKN